MVTEAVWDVFEEVLNKIFAARFLDGRRFFVLFFVLHNLSKCWKMGRDCGKWDGF